MSGSQQQLMTVGGGGQLASSLTPGANPGGQGGFLGFSTNPVVGVLTPQGPVGPSGGYNCAFISESQSGDAYIQVGFATPSLQAGLISGVQYGSSYSTGAYAATIYSGGLTIFNFRINQRSLVNGVPTLFVFL